MQLIILFSLLKNKLNKLKLHNYIYIVLKNWYNLQEAQQNCIFFFLQKLS